MVQLRQRVVEPQGEARSDTEIVFDLAGRLGLGAAFLGRRYRGRLSLPARPVRRFAGSAARAAGGSTGASTVTLPQVR